MTETTAQAAWGFGLATIDASGAVLDVWFPEPRLGEPPADASAPDALTDRKSVV